MFVLKETYLFDPFLRGPAARNLSVNTYLPNLKMSKSGTLLKGHTPLKFNMEPENGGLEDDVPFQLGAF